ncbi:SNF2 family N-terminal domain-containing protein [Amylocarpus encephaloides]|uniref:SNF2 family N-terminal domain-containing protein n=1 Tax=Amylocarpus encephaloides TaxID=45428 RepID=A0A9P8C577_9HELO|nr:SNF2 family N-terminal domain-containing protein [Amylocarpus encephaloides]
MEEFRSVRNMEPLKRPWPFDEQSEYHHDPLPVTESFQTQWDSNAPWDANYLSSNNEIFANHLNPPENSFRQAWDTHVTIPSAESPPIPESEHIQRLEVSIDTSEIIDVKARLKSTNMTQGGLFYTQGSTSYHIFGIVQEENHYSLEHSGNKFAILSKKTCNELQKLLKERELRLEFYVLRKEWSRVLQSWPKNKNTISLNGEINVYGAREVVVDAGNILSALGTFLQQPRFGLHGVTYFNPHYLPLPGFSDVNSLETPMLAINDNTTTTVAQVPPPEEQIDASVEVTSILDSLSHHDYLRQQVADMRIKSSLLPQVYPLQCSCSSLWEYNDTDSDEPFYQHILSGAKRAEQNEAKGGIIADDMGLGKSLVILATIAGSLDRALDLVSAEKLKLNSERNPQPTVPSRATLIIAPSSLLIDSWIDEIYKHTYLRSLTFHKHHGSGRDIYADKGKLQESDIVFTTYATAAAEFCKGGSTLAKIKWFRIVLDEVAGHDVRNRSTKQFQAVANLAAVHRWCLTGTPIQNTLEDLGALVAFLKVPILERAPTFRKYITNQSAPNARDRFSNLRLLLGTICLRRTRVLLDLPEPRPQIRKLSLTPLEQAKYDNMIQECKKAIDMVVSGNKKSRLNSTVLESLLKLRLFCNNSDSERGVRNGESGLPLDADEALSYLQQNEQAVCIYCTGPIYNIDNARDTDGGIWISTCSHLVPKLTIISIAFSSWKKTLTLIAELLTSRKIPFCRIDGSHSLAERGRTLTNFRKSSGANILLMTLGTGAVGLNLAVASRVYLLEPQWNPSIELQAIGRVLRLGQTDQVTIVRYIMKNTVEESNVLSRQRQKLKIASGGFTKGKGRISNERLQSLMDLFGVSV